MMFSEKEQLLLAEFRENVKDILKPEHDDYFLIRWLRARKFSPKDAEEMLRKSFAWRKKVGANDLLTKWQPPEVLKKFFPGGVCGFDKEGRPIYIGLTGDHLDMRGFSLSVKRTDFVKYCAYQAEYVQSLFRTQSEKVGHRVDKVILVGDMKTFKMRHLFRPGSDLLPKVLGIIESNYPDMLGTCYVLNAPSFFPMIFNICKPFLHEETRNKVVILGSNWREKLLEVIDADQLPVTWGGTQVGPNNDPDCQNKICLGGTVPKEYFMKGHSLLDPSKVKKATVGAGATFDLPFTVTSTEQTLRWVFWTENYDLSFSVYETSRDAPLVNMSRLNCHEVPEDGFLQCDKPGSYVVRFDNTYSWFHSKQLLYSVELVSTKEVEALGAEDNVNTADDEDEAEEATEAIEAGAESAATMMSQLHLSPSTHATSGVTDTSATEELDKISGDIVAQRAS